MGPDIMKDQFGCYPWIEDLFRDIKQKKMTVKKAAMMTGTRPSYSPAVLQGGPAAVHLQGVYWDWACQ